MALDLTSLANLGFPEILLWLLTFAVVYGVLSQAGEKGMPKSQGARAIIAIVSGFMVLFAAPTALLGVLTKMSSSLILVVVGLLILMVFLEVAGVKVGKKVIVVNEKGQKVSETSENVRLHEKYGREFGIVLIIVAIAIFIGAGGLQLLGLQNIRFSSQSATSVVFFGIILIAIVWMINEKKD